MLFVASLPMIVSTVVLSVAMGMSSLLPGMYKVGPPDPLGSSGVAIAVMEVEVCRLVGTGVPKASENGFGGLGIKAGCIDGNRRVDLKTSCVGGNRVGDSAVIGSKLQNSSGTSGMTLSGMRCDTELGGFC